MISHIFFVVHLYLSFVAISSGLLPSFCHPTSQARSTVSDPQPRHLKEIHPRSPTSPLLTFLIFLVACLLSKVLSHLLSPLFRVKIKLSTLTLNVTRHSNNLSEPCLRINKQKTSQPPPRPPTNFKILSLLSEVVRRVLFFLTYKRLRVFYNDTKVPREGR